MKQSFLDSLAGMNVKLAETACHKQGLETRTMPYGTASIMLAFANTVNIWVAKDGNTVHSANAGDPFEIDEEA